MSEVALTIKIFPREGEEPSSIVEEINKKIEVKEFKIEDIGFGIRVLKILLLVDDKEGEVERVEQILSSIDKISSFEIEDATRI